TPWSGSADVKITVVVVGRVKGPLLEATRHYEERAGHYWKLDVVEVEAGAGSKSDPDAVRAAEEERLLPRLGAGSDVVALTRGGQPMGSRAFASYLQDHAV